MILWWRVLKSIEKNTKCSIENKTLKIEKSIDIKIELDFEIEWSKLN